MTNLTGIMKSAALFSAGFALFTQDGKLLVLERAHPPESIPEGGVLALVAGFNQWETAGDVPTVAEAHLATRVGLQIPPSLTEEDFVSKLYPREAQEKPVKIPLGDGTYHLFYGPRISFLAKLVLTPAQVADIRLNPEYHSGWRTLNVDEFDEALRAGEISFPYEAKLVRSFF